MKALTSLTLVLFLATTTQAKQIPFNNDPEFKTVVKQLGSVFGKISSVFGSFNVHRQNDWTALSWNVSTGDVSSFVIERSYDGDWFVAIDEVAPATARWNKYCDKTVEPGIIYYRITAKLNDGSTDVSPVEMVKIVKHK